MSIVATAMVKVGLVGCGFMGTMHANVYSVLDGAELASVFDKSPERAAEFAAKWGGQVYGSYGEMLAEVDMVDICLPTYLHADFTVQACEAGKHVMCEKPMALSVADADRMVEAALKSGVKLMVGHGIRFWQGSEDVKGGVDERGGKYPKLAPEVYEAIVDEAHRHGMTVHAHAIRLADQKAVVAAGADVLVHMVQRQPLDEEFLALLREKRPYWATVIGLGDTPNGVCARDPFFEQALPDSLIAAIRAETERRSLAANCGPPRQARESQMAINFPQMLEAGDRVVLATDPGIHPGHTFGSGAHVELARWVQLGMTPAQAIVAATSRPAELMGLADLGTLAAGKRASFIVLDANTLDAIRNKRAISSVYLDGPQFDREALLPRVKGMGPTP